MSISSLKTINLSGFVGFNITESIHGITVSVGDFVGIHIWLLSAYFKVRTAVIFSHIAHRRSHTFTQAHKGIHPAQILLSVHIHNSQ